MDENIMKYLNKLHALEIDPNTNWNQYGEIVKFLDYRWRENEKWRDDDGKLHKGKWVSYDTATIAPVIFTLIARKEAKENFLYFANKVMEVEE